MAPDSPHPLQLQPLFPLALGQVQLAPDPLDTALLLRDILELRGEATGNPAEGCAWTGDLQRVWQLHRRPAFAPLLRTLVGHAGTYLERVGFARERVALHLQRSWPVVSAFGQGIGRHHHPNAHLSGVYYLNGDGSGRSGCLRFFPPVQPNELVPGLAVGYDGPIRADSQGAQLWNAPWVDVAPRAGLLLLASDLRCPPGAMLWCVQAHPARTRPHTCMPPPLPHPPANAAAGSSSCGLCCSLTQQRPPSLEA